MCVRPVRSYALKYIYVTGVSLIVNPKLDEKMESHFFRVMEGSIIEPLKSVSDVFDISDGLKPEELFVDKNIKRLEYLFTISAISFSTDTSASIIYPVIDISKGDTDVIFNYLKYQLTKYAKHDSKIKFLPIESSELIGDSFVQFEESDTFKVPSLVKWRIENEDRAQNTNLFLINNVNLITQSNTIDLKNIISELNSVSSDASFILFLKPSSYNFIKITLTDDEFQSMFSRSIFFEEFDISDVSKFKQIIINRINTSETTQKITIENLDLKMILALSRGIPIYAFKIVEEEIKNIIINNNENNSNIHQYLKDNITDIWKSIDELTPGQIDILTVFTTFPYERANIYEIQNKMKLFQKKVGKRAAILQQIRKLYENGLLERERPKDTREVYYKIKTTALPAIEFKIKDTMIRGK